MAGQVRRCAKCREPLRASARSDAKFCSRRCKAAHRRWRRHYGEAVAIGLAYLWGEPTEHVATCPQCGRLFALGRGHRRDAVYDRPACRQAAYRDRRAQRVREAVTETAGVTAPGPPPHRGPARTPR